VTTILRLSKTWEHFKRQFQELYGQTSLDFEEPNMELLMSKKELPTLSDYNKKLQQSLNWNPKDNE
jgi:hypothetical protein